MNIYLKHSKTRVSSVMEILANFVMSRKLCIHASRWMTEKDLLKHHYPERRNFTTT